ncbi:MAG: Phage integrase family protein [Candidatus Hydrogenedentes bacterium ADurb.Bin179]|nr:MAG: Phage integrase family protein [Candidatus Hydrogenedentes bacterium ADurb.Bin179]
MDGAGRVLDVHALRVTFGTMLARAGVGLATAQRLMRHSTPALTANVYTVLELTDTGAAVNALPSMQANTVEKESYNGE